MFPHRAPQRRPALASPGPSDPARVRRWQRHRNGSPSGTPPGKKCTQNPHGGNASTHFPPSAHPPIQTDIFWFRPKRILGDPPVSDAEADIPVRAGCAWPWADSSSADSCPPVSCAATQTTAFPENPFPPVFGQALLLPLDKEIGYPAPSCAHPFKPCHKKSICVMYAGQ